MSGDILMPEITWNPLKNKRLKKVRGVSFEEILQAKLVAIEKHPVVAHQNIMLFDYKEHIWIVPFVENKETIFLKTLYPSWKYTKRHKKGGYREED